VPQHCREAVYTHFLETLPVTRAYRLQRLAWRRQFVERWPELHIWGAAPLALRVGRLPGERRRRLTDRVCYRARHYLLFLALRGFIRLDYAWLLGAGRALGAIPWLTPASRGPRLGLAGPGQLGVR
jgi:hypothetical protein